MNYILSYLVTLCIAIQFASCTVKMGTSQLVKGDTSLCQEYKMQCPVGKICVVKKILWSIYPSCVHDAAAQAKFARDKICELSPREGNCTSSSHLRRYYFNIHSGRCTPFVYKGCDGNKNNFYSLNKCRVTCLTRAAILSFPVAEKDIKASLINNGNETVPKRKRKRCLLRKMRGLKCRKNRRNKHGKKGQKNRRKNRKNETKPTAVPIINRHGVSFEHNPVSGPRKEYVSPLPMNRKQELTSGQTSRLSGNKYRKVAGSGRYFRLFSILSHDRVHRRQKKFRRRQKKQRRHHRFKLVLPSLNAKLN